MAFVVRQSGRLVAPLNNYLRPAQFGKRCISTSKKNDETAVVTEKIPSHEATQNSHDVNTTAAATAAKKKWMNYGFHPTDQYEDVASAHMFSFLGVTVCIVLGSFAYYYGPDRTLRDWAQREAYLLVREREAKGLPLLDPNYVDESKIVLPSEEELGDFEIII
ncbi:NADH dehydrogenase [ubiquinone] 1 beta subcomplex subunit 11, mitochondrial-like [Daphnia carinata]|uniref:NADH dehydrogenase [ubiquinone] 1 beta subcomplex subunit 11, mitochondrial-like n=1 Tax=Daphnia carinata TaxID=120202 RepID=UPI00257BF57F|nr:NADH dehydrogenase [ubiquinone] 1 beta subcomplex subunit 11, mitochondrial-like [Daphnia carinata]